MLKRKGHGIGMFQILLEHKLLTGTIFISLLLSIICQVCVGVIFQSMIEETNNMSVTQNNLLKQCKQKYAGYYRMNGKMLNTGAFVDRFIQKICFSKINLTRLTHLSGQLMMLFILLTGVSICISLAAGKTLFQIIPYYLISILGLYLYFSVTGLMDVQEKKKVLKTNLMDYLENHMVPRLKAEKEILGEEANVQQNDAKEKSNIIIEEAQKEKDLNEFNRAEDRLELENLLEEFFA